VLPPGGAAILSFQCDQSFFSATGSTGASNDVDIFFVTANGAPIVTCDPATTQTLCQFSGVDNKVGGDARAAPPVALAPSKVFAARP
jgi:hypothetical protein